MKAMLHNSIIDLLKDKNPLMREEVPVPTPCENEILIKVSRYGVCHTELDEIERRTPTEKFPVILEEYPLKEANCVLTDLDHAGFELKKYLLVNLRKTGHEVKCTFARPCKQYTHRLYKNGNEGE